MNLLIDELREHLATGLLRRASTTCSKWAENYIILGKPIPGPLGFGKHPWERDMMDHNGNWVGMKAAQMGFTNVALARGIFTIDIKRTDVLYVLPKRNPDAADFSKAKFDSLLSLSPHLEALFSDTRNVGHKQAGNVNFFLRGSRSRSALKSISVGLQIYDEFDEMPVKNISLAEERSSGFDEEDTQKIKISTPTVPDYGIDKEIQLSTRDHYFFKCPRCGRQTELTYPECLVITADNLHDERRLRDSHLICRECKKPLDHKAKPDWLSLRNASWEPTADPTSYTRGFEIHQLYSMMVPPWKIAHSVLKAKLDPAEDQELHNSKLGRVHLVEGARIGDGMIELCIGNHRTNDPIPKQQFLTMGVDVGHKELYYEIDQWLLPRTLSNDLNSVAVCKIIKYGTVDDFINLDQLMYEYQIAHCVIDIDPYFRNAFDFSNRFAGHVHLCRFIKGIASRNIIIKDEENTVHVNRTSWLDLSQGRFKRGHKGIILPIDTSEMYRTHIKALVRLPRKDKDGNPVSKYISVGPDHSAFARVYAETALPLAVSIQENQDIRRFL